LQWNPNRNLHTTYSTDICELVKYSMTWSSARSFCDSWAFCFLRFWYLRACDQWGLSLSVQCYAWTEYQFTWVCVCACRYCVNSVVQNGVFTPPGLHIAPINVNFGTTAGPLPRAKFHVYRGRNVGIQLLTAKIWNFAHKFAPRKWLVCTSFTKFSGDKQPIYKHLPSVGAFPTNFQ